MTTPENGEWLSLADVAEIRGISPSTIRAYVVRGSCPAYDGPTDLHGRLLAPSWQAGTILPWLEAPRSKGGRPRRRPIEDIDLPEDEGR